MLLDRQLAKKVPELTLYFWVIKVLTTGMGETTSDYFVHRYDPYLGVPYIYSATLYAGSVVIIFGLWYLSERTLSVHSIYMRRREIFYWAAVLATFAMGTAVGDMTAVTFRLGFFASGIVFAVAIAIPALAYRFLHVNEIAAFWFAYIITRPLGASFADWLAVPQDLGGLNLGKGPVSIALWLLIFGFVAYLAITRKDVAPSKS